jgi:hypothetical protein
MTRMSGLLIAGGGFLVGVLWMDLLFDTQILRLPAQDVVGIVVVYYENAALRAYPMNRLIGLVMIATAAGAIYQTAKGRIDRRALAATACCGIAVGLALLRVVPNAMRLGARPGSIEEQIALARAICFDHIVCLLLMSAFVALQIRARARLESGAVGR